MKRSQLRVLQMALVCACAFIFLPSAVAAAPRAAGAAPASSAAAQGTNVPPRVPEAMDVEKLVTLRGNTHPLARPEFDQGAAPDSLPMRRMLLLLQRSPEQEAELRHLLDEQQTKSSPNFHHWLTPAEFGQRFGPADEDIQAVTDWLTSQGFQVNRVAAGRTVIEFSGTAGQVRQAFHTEIHKYVVNSEEHWANASDPQIPAALAPVVTSIASLNSFRRRPLHRVLGTFERSKLTGQVKPLFTFSVNGISFYGLGPSDFATIYNVLPLWNAGTDGTGQSIAIVASSNINLQDARDFRSLFGLPAHDPQVILDGPDPGLAPGYETEADLDVQWAGAVAKNATIELVVSEDTESSAGVDLSALYVVDNNLAPVMSDSFGECEARLTSGMNAFYNALWQQAAAQGMTVVVAAGDNGSSGCGPTATNTSVATQGLGVSGVASTPFNVAVGGTDFDDFTDQATYWNSSNNPATGLSANSYIPEITWNSTCARAGVPTGCTNNVNSGGLDLAAGGGGPSSLYSKPAWQTGLGVPTDSLRDIPDVSLFASLGVVTSNGNVTAGSLSFYIICARDLNAAQGGNSASCDLNSPYLDFQTVGGTSASAPAFAAVMALINQKTGERQGNANYVLYNLAAQSGASCDSTTAPLTGSSCIFYDITKGNNSVACASASPNCSNQTINNTGILVVNPSASPQVPAWNTNAGYDLATGLGSVNAANLVNNWASVSFTPSTTTLSLSTTPATNPITLTHGQPVNVSIQVAPQSGSGTPTGDVSLIAQVSSSQSNAAGMFTLSSGTASGTSSLLPGGSYNVIAHYAGDGMFGASDSSPVSVTVNPESSQTEIGLVTFNPTTGAVTSSNATTATYGTPYLLRVDVGNAAGTFCQAYSLATINCPSGQVSITDNGNPLGAGTYLLNSQGYTEDQALLTNQFLAGTHNIVASYGGDVSYKSSTSGSVPVAITPAPTTIAFGGVGYIVVGDTATYSAYLSTASDGAAPTGTVTFLNGSTPMGTVPFEWALPGTFRCAPNATGFCASASASFTTTFSAVGTITVMAEYSGDNNYAPSSSYSYTTTITDFSVSANPSSLAVTAGQSGTSTITINPINGFSEYVTPTCSGLPPGTSCTFASPYLFVNANTGGSTTLTLSTTASLPPQATKRKAPPSFRLKVGLPWLAAWLLALLLAVAVMGRGALRAPAGGQPAPAQSGSPPLRPLVMARRYRRTGWVPAAGTLLAATLLVLGIWVACGGGGGGGGGSTGTPAVSLSPSSLTFGNQDVGTTSAPQSVTLTNTGNAALSISGITLYGTNATDFSQSSNCGTSVAAGANCTINVTFAPKAAGARTAYVDVSDNAAGSPQAVTLSGTATQPTPKGTSTFIVTATEAGGASRSTTITLTVQ